MTADNVATLAKRELQAIGLRMQDRLYYLGCLELAIGNATRQEQARLSVEALDFVRDVLDAQLRLVEMMDGTIERLTKPE